MRKILLAITTVAAMALFAPVPNVQAKSNTEPAIAPAPVPKVQAGAPESSGDPMPLDIELHDMTPELAKKAKSHKFYVTEDAIVLAATGGINLTLEASPATDP